MDKQYHEAEMKRFYGKMQSIEKAPLHERKEAREEWAETLTMPNIVSRNLSFLLHGDYGYGELQRAKWIVANETTGGKIVKLACLLAALDNSCPASFAIGAWKSLTTEQQEAVNLVVQKEIDNYLRKQEEEN